MMGLFVAIGYAAKQIPVSIIKKVSKPNGSEEEVGKGHTKRRMIGSCSNL